jgi:hypothetical protein
MNRLRWALANTGWGWPGAIGIGLLVAAALVQFTVLQPLRDRIDALARETSLHGAPVASDDRHGQLERFYRHLSAEKLPERLAALHAAAKAEGLVLQQGEYRLVRERGGRLKRYQVTLPVQGPYPAVRRFIAKALDEIPVAALEHVLFERKRIGDGVVEAQVRFTIFLADP